MNARLQTPYTLSESRNLMFAGILCVQLQLAINDENSSKRLPKQSGAKQKKWQTNSEIGPFVSYQSGTLFFLATTEK